MGRQGRLGRPPQLVQWIGGEPMVDEGAALLRNSEVLVLWHSHDDHLGAWRLDLNQESILQQVHQQETKAAREHQVGRFGVLCELVEHPPFQVTVAAVEDREVCLVLHHRQAVDVSVVVPRVAGRAQSDEVVERVLLNLLPRDDVRDFDWDAATCGDRAAVAGFDFDFPAQGSGKCGPVHDDGTLRGERPSGNGDDLTAGHDPSRRRNGRLIP